MDCSPAPSCPASPTASDLEFSERPFFLEAFQGSCLTFVLSQSSGITPSALTAFRQLLQDLAITPWQRNKKGGKVLILFQDSQETFPHLQPFFASLAPHLFSVSGADGQQIPSILWHPNQQHDRPPVVAMGVVADTLSLFQEKILQVGLLLRMSRLLWVDAEGGIKDAHGRLIPFFSPPRLLERADENSCSRRPLLTLLHRLLLGGVKAISLCRFAELDQELFTYQGMGTFFSRQPYCRVRRLGLDDFAYMAAIIRKGEQEGFLLPRSEKALAHVLAGGYGAFILEDRLAGICALESAAYQAEGAGEIVSLYTLTRFQGSGVGGQLLNHVVQDAKRQGLQTLFACTRHERVAEFFARCRFGRQRQGFSRVEADRVPQVKWHTYDPERKKQIICLRLDLRKSS
ncbi:MAG: GNAT family N-acetyltransferase [Magnetococcus sp. YQC-3]